MGPAFGKRKTIASPNAAKYVNIIWNLELRVSAAGRHSWENKNQPNNRITLANLFENLFSHLCLQVYGFVRNCRLPWLPLKGRQDCLLGVLRVLGTVIDDVHASTVNTSSDWNVLELLSWSYKQCGPEKVRQQCN